MYAQRTPACSAVRANSLKLDHSSKPSDEIGLEMLGPGQSSMRTVTGSGLFHSAVNGQPNKPGGANNRMMQRAGERETAPG